ncbi:hypothetical protein ESP70_007525 [Aeromicrobium ginsengisoli]|uniref:Uncharacterized protein n=1 Tax=Aeromicrobium ginsengisoli TaxID=363867 RepID=A0A5M4FHN0_9ACTN|nr:hypothetical protein ESP70_007525 [Aeromicrobium ginsengisoli]
MRDELKARGFSCQVTVPRTRSALSIRQISDAGFEDVHLRTWPELVEDSLRSDVVVCALAGPMTQRLSIDLSEATGPGAPGPVLVSGWVGVIIEKITAGYLDRAGTDVVAVNSAHDLAYFRRTAGTLGLSDGNLLLSGLPFLSSDPAPERTGEIQRVLFADQPTVPGSRVERLYVYRRLIDYAREHPDRLVILKPRHRPGEDTFHRMAHHPADLLKGDELPANFLIDYTPIGIQLPHVDLLLTMSSTACLEAIDNGCRVALVLDLGVHERYGNHVFLDSGLLRTFDEIKKDEIGSPDPAWLDGYFGDRTQPAKRAIVDRVEELLESGDRPSHQIWGTPYFRSAVEMVRAKDAIGTSRISPAWARRMRARGPVLGTVAQGAHLLLPPVIIRPIRWVLRRVSSR